MSGSNVEFITAEGVERWRRTMNEGLRGLASKGQNLGFGEESLRQGVGELFRPMLQQYAQARADATAANCPQCGCPLHDVRRRQARYIETPWGRIRVQRAYGHCASCRRWSAPADAALGLDKNTPASPLLQEMSALLVSQMPAAMAAPVLERVAGVRCEVSTLHRCARREGEQARSERAAMDQSLQTLAGYDQTTAQAKAEAPPRPFTMVLELDAWNIRERDHWGESAALRAEGKEPGRWHWVYTGTCFRLDQRGQTAGGRAVISERGYVFTRAGPDALGEQLRAEALRRGLAQAASVLVVADAALWIWKLVGDRFAGARQRVDYWHAHEHLWAAAREIHPDDEARAKEWVEPLLRQLRETDAVPVIGGLEEVLPRLRGARRERVEAECNYFRGHAERMDYGAGKRVGEPVGSGAVEATCRQGQIRFKRTGQFWTSVGDEALLSLEVFWRNGRWSRLYPHATWSESSRN